MIEIATCMNDLSKDAVWRGKHAYTRLAKITRVWLGKEDGKDVTNVGFRLWDSQGTEEERDAWKVGKVLIENDFREIFVYAEHHNLNYAREAEKTQYLLTQARDAISDAMSVEFREEGLKALEAFETLTKRAAGYKIALHDWDEGCAGSGCCADTADMGGELLIDQNFLSAEEIERLHTKRA